MTQQTIPVSPSIVTTVHVALPSGATLYNNDSVNSVWVSNSPGVSPNNGMRVGPKGSLQWTTNGSACYACLDAGLTDPVTLTVSDDVANLNNPVDIGVAVATQLLAKGVPSVLLSDTVFDGYLAETSNMRTRLGIDFSKYATINLTLTTLTDCKFTLYWYDGSPEYELSRTTYQLTSGLARSISLSQTVRGATLAIVFNGQPYSAMQPYVSINATNRPQRECVSGVTPLYRYSYNRTWVSGQVFSTGVPITTNGGLMDIVLQWSTPATGYMGYQYIDPQGLLQTILQAGTYNGIVDAGSTFTHGQYALPPGTVQPVFYATTAGASTATLTITPGDFA